MPRWPDLQIRDEQKIQRAIETLRSILKAAENGNQAGEDAAVLAVAAPDLLFELQAIKRFGELCNLSVHGSAYSGGKKPATKDMFAFPRHMLPDIDAAITQATAR